MASKYSVCEPLISCNYSNKTCKFVSGWQVSNLVDF